VSRDTGKFFDSFSTSLLILCVIGEFRQRPSDLCDPADNAQVLRLGAGEIRVRNQRDRAHHDEGESLFQVTLCSNNRLLI